MFITFTETLFQHKLTMFSTIQMVCLNFYFLFSISYLYLFSDIKLTLKSLLSKNFSTYQLEIVFIIYPKKIVDKIIYKFSKKYQ